VEICGKPCAPGAQESAASSLTRGLSCEDTSASREFLSACSACAGEYEDPDRTAWSPDLDDPPEDDEFPAKEE
jgi:hypothetical protein